MYPLKKYLLFVCFYFFSLSVRVVDIEMNNGWKEETRNFDRVTIASDQRKSKRERKSNEAILHSARHSLFLRAVQVRKSERPSAADVCLCATDVIT